MKKLLTLILYTFLIFGLIIFGYLITAQAATKQQAQHNTYPPPQKQTSTGPVKVVGRQLLEDFDRDGVYNPFLIKGVVYSPYPIGEYPSYQNVYDDVALINRDYPLLKAMHANAIRVGNVTHNFMRRLDELNAQNNYHLMVIVGWGVDQSLDFSDPEIRTYIIRIFGDYVDNVKGYNSLLFFAIGNENNIFVNPEVCKRSDFYSLANEMAQAAYVREGAGYHPVAIVNGNILDIGRTEDTINSTDADLPYIDIWGANVYIGYSFLDWGLFNDYAHRSNKPFWISEYGIDVYDIDNDREDEARQADYDGHLWDEIAANTDICIGATVFEYSDEWWRDGDLPDPHGPNNHDLNGWYIPFKDITPDNYSNEEYYGMMRIQDNGTNPDIMIPRQVYYRLKEKFSAVGYQYPDKR